MLQWGTPFDLNEYIKWSNYFKNKNIKKKNYSLNKNTINLMLLAGRGSRYVKEGFKTLINLGGWLPEMILRNCWNYFQIGLSQKKPRINLKFQEGASIDFGRGMRTEILIMKK